MGKKAKSRRGAGLLAIARQARQRQQREADAEALASKDGSSAGPGELWF